MSFALGVLRLTEEVPFNPTGTTIARQLTRCSTSVAANYRAALRGKSRADFLNKVTIVLEEADEAGFWLELIERTGLLPGDRLHDLRIEAEELTKIFNATRVSIRNGLRERHT